MLLEKGLMATGQGHQCTEHLVKRSHFGLRGDYKFQSSGYYLNLSAMSGGKRPAGGLEAMVGRVGMSQKSSDKPVGGGIMVSNLN